MEGTLLLLKFNVLLSHTFSRNFFFKSGLIFTNDKKYLLKIIFYQLINSCVIYSFKQFQLCSVSSSVVQASYRH